MKLRDELSQILDDVFDIAHGYHPEDYANLKKGMLNKALAKFDAAIDLGLSKPAMAIGGSGVKEKDRAYVDGYNQGVRDYETRLLDKLK